MAVAVDISWADPARLESREGTLGKADQSINIVWLRRQNPMAPFSIVFLEEPLKANRRLIRDENRLIRSAFGAQPQELAPQANARVGGIILALQEQHRIACGGSIRSTRQVRATALLKTTTSASW